MQASRLITFGVALITFGLLVQASRLLTFWVLAMILSWWWKREHAVQFRSVSGFCRC